MLLPMHSRMGLTLLKTYSLSAPTMKVKVPAAAPVTPPDTGASTKVILWDLPAVLRDIDTVGDMVLQSIINESLAAFLKRPPSDWQTFWECSELGSMVTKILASFATCLTYLRKTMLCLRASSYFLVSISKAKTWCPRLARLIAIGNPILPNPTKPICDDKVDLNSKSNIVISTN